MALYNVKCPQCPRNEDGTVAPRFGCKWCSGTGGTSVDFADDPVELRPGQPLKAFAEDEAYGSPGWTGQPQTRDGNPPPTAEQEDEEAGRNFRATMTDLDQKYRETWVGSAQGTGLGLTPRLCQQCRGELRAGEWMLDGQGPYCKNCHDELLAVQVALVADMVKHPAHYKQVPGIECIAVTQHFNFNKGNAIKYIWRAGAKGDEIEDLRKAIQYCEFEIARLSEGPTGQ